MIGFFKSRRVIVLGIISAAVICGGLLISNLAKQNPVPSFTKAKLLVFPEKYSAIMSSTPGICISTKYKGDVEKIRYSTESGRLFIWDTSSGKISKGAKTIELPYENPVYWTPLENNGQVSVHRNNDVTVILLDEKGEKIDEKLLNILCDGSLYYTVKSSMDIIIAPERQSQVQNPNSLDSAVSLAIKAQKIMYGAGETETEGHIILDSEEKDEIVKVYTIASFGAFGFENNIFAKVSGSGAIPTVITFSKNEKGEYSLLEYKEPEDGTRYMESVKEMFSKKLQGKVFSADKYYPELIKQQEAQASEYLKSIGRKSRVSEAHVDKELVDINVEASNKLFAEFTKYDSFLNNCPYWIGTREKIESGSRYIYKTSQDKTIDGCDLVIFRKLKEDGTVVEEYKYKIEGNEPQLVE